MPQIPDLLTMLKAGAHFGHQQGKRNPKMEPYIFTAKGGLHIINLEKTQEKLAEALAFVKELVSKNGTILFLGTKKQAQPIIAQAAKACSMPYVNERWLGGTLTNFREISRVIRKYIDLKKRRATGQLEKYTKKEQLDFSNEIIKLDKVVGGIESLTKVPEAIFIIDLKKEKTALAEALKKNIPVVAICDTNADPQKITYPIPGNDDAIKSIELFTNLIAEAVKEGQKEKGEVVVEKKSAVKK